MSVTRSVNVFFGVLNMLQCFLGVVISYVYSLISVLKKLKFVAYNNTEEQLSGGCRKVITSCISIGANNIVQ